MDNIVIKDYEESDLESLNILLKEVYNLEKKKNMGINKEVVAKDNSKVVGYLVVNELYNSVEDIKYIYLNYVCVLESYRNMGICSKMLDYVFEYCKKNKISYIELTSNSKREAARYLYSKKGFEIRKTNVFRKEIL